MAQPKPYSTTSQAFTLDVGTYSPAEDKPLPSIGQPVRDIQGRTPDDYPRAKEEPAGKESARRAGKYLTLAAGIVTVAVGIAYASYSRTKLERVAPLSIAEYYAKAGRKAAYDESVRLNNFVRTHDREDRQAYFNDMMKRLGPSRALETLLISQTQAKAIPIPAEGTSEFRELKYELSKAYGFDVRGAKSADQLSAALFGSVAQPVILSPEGIALHAAGEIVNSIFRSYHVGNEAKYIEALSRVNSAVNARQRAFGRPLTMQEARTALYEGNQAIDGRAIPLNERPDYSIYRRTSSASSSTETRTFIVGATEAEERQRYMRDQANQKNRQMLQNLRQTPGGQYAERAGAAAYQGFQRAAPFVQQGVNSVGNSINSASPSIQQGAERSRQMINQGVSQAQQGIANTLSGIQKKN